LLLPKYSHVFKSLLLVTVLYLLPSFFTCLQPTCVRFRVMRFVHC
jgi:hypothetical protein